MDGYYINKLLDAVDKKIQKLCKKFGDSFIHAASQNGKYFSIDKFEWTKAFYTGILWNLYIYSKNDDYKKIALSHCDKLIVDAERGGIKNHDVGFLYNLSCIAGYKITSNERLLAGARVAADILKDRFIPEVGIIQAWGDVKQQTENSGRIIIDTFMNLPILYYMAEQFSDDTYRNIANSHLNKAIKYLIRSDFTTYHTYFFDIISGDPVAGKTHQGKNDESMWARGQAWAIYAFPIIYGYNKDRKDLIPLARKLLDVFLEKLPNDFVCPWDFDFEDYSEVAKDAGTMPIVALGILEMLKYKEFFTAEELNKYKKIVFKIIESLVEQDYISTEEATWEDGLVRHSVYAYHYRGVNEFCLWGDYFYVELLMKLYNDKYVSFW